MAFLGAIVLLTAASMPAPPRTRVVTSHHATIWPASSLTRFRFCSRGPIAPGSKGWTPRWTDIATVETALPQMMTAWRERTKDRNFLTPGQFEQIDWSARWNRNYIGIIRQGRRLLYIDFAPLPARDGFSVCDGGPGFFGMEIDARRHRITMLDVNTVA